MPELLVHEDARHGVARYARDVAGAVARITGAEAARTLERLEPGHPVHVHFTDRLWADAPEAAATAFERLAATSPVTVTLHDVPQASDGPRNLPRRAESVRRVASAARGVFVNSGHEAALLREFVGVEAHAVIPLPVDPHPPVPRPAARAEAAVIGWFYPGKGHAEVVDAVAVTGLPLAVAALGAASPGHEGELRQLIEDAAERGVHLEPTGFLTDADLLDRCRAAAVPVAMHQHVSASGSIATWIAAGRRPLVPDTRYSREMAELRPGTVCIVAEGGLAAAITSALRHPESTWLAPDASTGPDLDAVARAYLAWWGGIAW